MEKFVTAAVIVGALLLIVLGVTKLEMNTTNGNQGKTVSSSEFGAGFNSAATSSTHTIGGTSQFVLASSTSRVYARIANASSTAILSCNMDYDGPAVSGSGIVIPPNGVYEMSLDRENNYRGKVNCITPGGNSTVAVFAHEGRIRN